LLVERLLFGRSTPRAATSEQEAVDVLYHDVAEVDAGLIERLLWWEGLESPGIARERA
jgi:hypothetical protein